MVGNTAQAHEVRFIASYGDNANLCTRSAPCLTLQRGINITPAGGELIILDSGDYGSNGTIGKSITISASGASATIGNSITIDNADATVVLRGLRLNGASATGTNGINSIAASAVYIENCEVQNFLGNGIFFDTRSNPSEANPKLFVLDSVIHNNGEAGLHFATDAGGTLTIDNSRFEHNGNHGVAMVDIEATITRAIMSGNNGHGIVQLGASANITWTTAANNGGTGYSLGSGQMTVEQSVARGNSNGLSATNSTATVSNSVLTNNIVGLSIQGGNATILTRGNNVVSGNTTDVSGTLTPLAGT
jgi:hypothetical protein